MTWEQYRKANQSKGMADDSNRLYVAWFNLYERPEKKLVNDAFIIINNN